MNGTVGMRLSLKRAVRKRAALFRDRKAMSRRKPRHESRFFELPSRPRMCIIRIIQQWRNAMRSVLMGAVLLLGACTASGHDGEARATGQRSFDVGAFDRIALAGS